MTLEQLKERAEYAKALLAAPQPSMSQDLHTVLTGWIQAYEKAAASAAHGGAKE